MKVVEYRNLKLRTFQIDDEGEIDQFQGFTLCEALRKYLRKTGKMLDFLDHAEITEIYVENENF